MHIYMHGSSWVYVFFSSERINCSFGGFSFLFSSQFLSLPLVNGDQAYLRLAMSMSSTRLVRFKTYIGSRTGTVVLIWRSN